MVICVALKSYDTLRLLSLIISFEGMRCIQLFIDGSQLHICRQQKQVTSETFLLMLWNSG